MNWRFWPKPQERDIDRMLHWLMLKCESLEEWMFWREAYLALCDAWAPPPRLRMTPDEIKSVRLCQETWFCFNKPDIRGQARLRRQVLTDSLAALDRLEARGR